MSGREGDLLSSGGGAREDAEKLEAIVQYAYLPTEVSQPIASGAAKHGESAYNVARAGMTK